MKQHFFKFMMAAIALLLSSTSVIAHDVEINGIYYNLVPEEKQAVVTYQGENSWSAAYSNSVVIPPTIESGGVTYNVTDIGDDAFRDCSGLASVTIPSSVTYIGFSAFLRCSSLTSIFIPSSVTRIRHGAFNECSGLTSIIVDGENPEYDSRENCNAIIEKKYNYLIAGCQNTIIPSSVESIDEFAFSNSAGLNSITIPSSVIRILNYAFSNTGLTSITIPESVIIIGTNPFSGCSELTSINVDGGNSKYDSRENCNAIIETSSNALIAGCQNTIIPSSVTSISNYAFSDCSSLTSITIPSSVISIKYGAFQNCSGLTSVVIPAGVTTIGDYAFGGCSGLTSITISEGVTSIGDGGFCDCPGLISIIIPSSVTTIGWAAFAGCSGLTSVVVKNSIPLSITSDYTFSNRANATLYVPAGSKAAYEAADYWKEFKEIVEIASTEMSLVDGQTYNNDTELNMETISYTRTFNSTEWQAIYLPFQMSYSDWSTDFEVARINDVHQFDDDDNGTIDRTLLEVIKLKEGSTTEANTPYVIKAKSTGEKTISVSNTKLYKAVENTFTVSSWQTLFTFGTTYSPISASVAAAQGYLVLGSGSLHPMSASASDLSSFRWYLKVTDRNGNPKGMNEVKLRVVGEDETNLDLPTPSPSLMRGDIYDLSGRRVEKMQKGLYIVNGKKVYVR